MGRVALERSLSTLDIWLIVFGVVVAVGVVGEAEDKALEFDAAATKLTDILNAEGLTTVYASAGDDVPNHDTIHVKIGKKP